MPPCGPSCGAAHRRWAGSFYRCACGREHFAYHSCNHRACPRCGRDDAAAWLAQQRTRLLPVPYFLATFTVPEELREPIRAARQPWYGALLKESAGRVAGPGRRPQTSGRRTGLDGHAANLDAGSAVSSARPSAGARRRTDPRRAALGARPNPEFFLPQVKLAARFKGRLKAWLKQHEPELFKQVPAKVWWMKWVADIQPVGSRRGGLEISGPLPLQTARCTNASLSLGCDQP